MPQPKLSLQEEVMLLRRDILLNTSRRTTVSADTVFQHLKQVVSILDRLAKVHADT